ncbi:MAG: SOS response-associated peptidase [Bacteroidia bacterium]|nr:SOS response-associated peptidase [Bacteroidia bacterium]
MLDRYSITASPEVLAQRFAADVPEGYAPRYNAAPSQLLPIITSDSPEGISFFYWGISPAWAKNKSISERIINLRAGLLSERPIALKNLKKRRCVVPADGFYGWKKVGKKTTIPYRFLLKSKKIFSFAGIWEEYDDEEGNASHTFSVITVPANQMVSSVSETMPAIFDGNAEKIWLNKNSNEVDLLKLLVPLAEEELDNYTISPRIYLTTNDGPSLLLPTPPSDQFGNLTLFD